MIQAMFDLMNQGLLLTTGLTVIPALLVVFIGEIARIRSALYYVVGGGLALAAVPLLARYGQGGIAASRRTRWSGRCSPPPGLPAASSIGCSPAAMHERGAGCMPLFR